MTSHPRIWELEPYHSHYKRERKMEGVTPVARFVKKGTAADEVILAGAGEKPVGITIERPNPKVGSSEYDDYADEEWGWVLVKATQPVLVETAAATVDFGEIFKVAATGLATAAAATETGYLFGIERVAEAGKVFVRGLLMLEGRVV